MDAKQEHEGYKVRSLLGQELSREVIQAKYDEIYQQEEVWRRRTFVGYASLILHLLREELPDKYMLDAGCGAGKLSLMASRIARHVDGLDLSAQTLEIGCLLSALTNTDNITFIQGAIEDLPEEKKYDVITLVGTLEHVMEPVVVLHKLSAALKPSGVLMIECPGFLNFRGDIYMTLLTLLDLPMSLADIRQIDYLSIREYANQTALRLETVCGYSYALGWLEKGVQDLLKRIPAAIRDKGAEQAGWSLDRLQWWMERRLSSNRLFIERLYEEGILQRIPIAERIVLPQGADRPPHIPEKVWAALEVYLDDDCYDDPYYCVTAPYCYFGGGTIYLLRLSSTPPTQQVG